MGHTNEYRADWRAAHKDHIKEYDREWAARNATKRAEYSRRHQQKIRIRIIDFLGGKCVQCGYGENVLALDIDHINNDGKADRAGLGWYKYYKKVWERGCTGLQVLCCNCHAIKTRTY